MTTTVSVLINAQGAGHFQFAARPPDFQSPCRLKESHVVLGIRSGTLRTARRTGVAANWLRPSVSAKMPCIAWKEAGLKPYRPERYMSSNDPDFETIAADIVGLYL